MAPISNRFSSAIRSDTKGVKWCHLVSPFGVRLTLFGDTVKSGVTIAVTDFWPYLCQGAEVSVTPLNLVGELQNIKPLQKGYVKEDICEYF